MTPVLEVTLGIIGGGAALSACVKFAVSAFNWAISKLIREEVAPIIEKFTLATNELTRELIALKTSFNAAIDAQEKGNADIHAAIDKVGDRLDEHNERIADAIERIAAVEERTHHMRRAGDK